MNFDRFTRLGIAGALTLVQWALCFSLLGYTPPLSGPGAVARTAAPSAVTLSRTAPALPIVTG